MSLDEAVKQFPCFYLSEKTAEKATLGLKYPTFAIRIINNKMKYDEIQTLLYPEKNFYIYDESNVFLIPGFIQVQSTAILCLYTNLLDNINLAEKIQTILQRQGVKTERCVASAYYPFPIKVDDDGLFEIIHMQE